MPDGDLVGVAGGALDWTGDDEPEVAHHRVDVDEVAGRRGGAATAPGTRPAKQCADCDLVLPDSWATRCAEHSAARRKDL